ncbi:hypothetical protein MKW94_012543 [Papaver nudicaule]|uniref:Fe2OG dioxygenase domain-containing protein n=1 Tax=Papaver nudicaule TaxID=74823 RepID=A0AA41W2I5_PAPNU|nr:hypothetical protein [Papaver nudicaule]
MQHGQSSTRSTISNNSCNTIFENSLKKEKEPDTDQLPLIDISSLTGVGSSTFLEKQKCKRQIIEASKQWGFFQVVNHGISNELLKKMNDEQMKLFGQPYDEKSNKKVSLSNSFLSNAYRSGTPTPTNQFSWFEAFHIPLSDIRSGNPQNPNNNTLRTTIEKFTTTLSELALKIAEVLAENVGCDAKGLAGYFAENCSEKTCYLRLNRYPPCPISSDQVVGLMPHTDSDFLTILYQDQVGGLQLVKDNKWVTVKPNPQYLIINIGDLFQAWSNDLYKSVEHRVMTNNKFERFSAAYLLCPSHDTVIQSKGGPPLYKKFSFGEFREQVQEDVRKLGRKVGLPRFRL